MLVAAGGAATTRSSNSPASSAVAERACTVTPPSGAKPLDLRRQVRARRRQRLARAIARPCLPSQAQPSSRTAPGSPMSRSGAKPGSPGSVAARTRTRPQGRYRLATAGRVRRNRWTRCCTRWCCTSSRSRRSCRTASRRTAPQSRSCRRDEQVPGHGSERRLDCRRADRAVRDEPVRHRVAQLPGLPGSCKARRPGHVQVSLGPLLS